MSADSAASGGSAPAPEIFLLGVDGGGTKTAAWLAVANGMLEPRIVGRGRAGCSNPRAVGLELAQTELANAVAAAWVDAGQTARPADFAVLAVAGAGRPDIAAAMSAWAVSAGLASRAEMVHDAEAVLAAGTPDGWGVALIAGTGSSAIAVAPDGSRHVCGGWGYRFGDEGSGYWLGRGVLAAVSRAVDGREPPTALTEIVMQHFGVADCRAIVETLNHAPNDRQAMAALAPSLAIAAEQGDVAACQLQNDAADALTALVAAAAEARQLPHGYPLAVAGGVLCGWPALREQVARRLGESPVPPGDVQLVPDPVAGCLRLAAMRSAAAN